MDDLRRDEPLHFAAARDLYRLHDTATPGDVLDQINARLAQLVAMLAVARGFGLENFRGCSPDVQDNYLWSCEQIARECEELARRLPFPDVKG